MQTPDRQRSGTILSPGPLRVALAATLSITAVLLCGAPARAYSRYSVNRDATNCRGCHGDFRASGTYVSKSDGVQWKDPGTGTGMNLHDGHRTYMLSGDCSTCHGSGSRFPVLTYSSAGGTGLAPIACLGCHGRPEPNYGGGVSGVGLRQHHYRKGITVCLDCHDDADPANFTTANEHTFPPYYAMPDANHPDKPANPCNIGGSEGAIAPPRGLDNDGDLVYDGSEPECDLVPAHKPTWGSLKALYR